MQMNTSHGMKRRMFLGTNYCGKEQREREIDRRRVSSTHKVALKECGQLVRSEYE